MPSNSTTTCCKCGLPTLPLLTHEEVRCATVLDKPHFRRVLENFRIYSLSICFLIILCFLSLPVQAEGLQSFVYDVYAGGVHAVEASITTDLSKEGRYSVSLGARTRGFLGKVAPWNGIFESHGWVEKDGEYRPELHRSTATWKGDKEVKSYHYGRDRSFKGLEIQDHDGRIKNKDVEDSLTRGTTDALSATLSVMRDVAAGQNCAGSEEVFDGKRRFNQVFVSQGREELKVSKYNVFGGQAEICTVEVVPIAGKWYEKPRGWMSIQEQGRDRGTMPTVWMGMIEGHEVALPVKIRVKTDYGTLFMHLTEYAVDGEVVQVAKRKK